MKEITILSRHYLNWYYYFTNINFPLPQVLNSYPQNFCYAGNEIFKNYLLNSTSNLIKIKQNQFLYPTLDLAKLRMRNDYPAKLRMRNDYLSSKFIKSKIKNICISYKDKLCYKQIYKTHLIQKTECSI